MNKKVNRSFTYLIMVVLLITAAYLLFAPTGPKTETVPISKVVEQAQNEEIEKITVKGNNLDVVLKNESKEKSTKESGTALSDYLKSNGVSQEKVSKIKVEVQEVEDNSLVLTLVTTFLPFLLIVGFFYFIMRQAQGGANQALSFGKSKARTFDANNKQRIYFRDVAGSEEAKQELLEVVDFLKNPRKFLSLGAKIPKGVLLVGPPGTGKTLMAKAVAGEAGVPFFSISGSEFVEMFVGVGASRVRDLFNKAKRNAPCIIFIDEIDAVGRQRGTGLGGSHDEREQTLNQILVEMDGFETGTNVIVMAATNRPDVLDPALLRPGRFDRRVVLDVPDVKDREKILQVHTRNKPLGDNVDLKQIAQRTSGFSGADLENLANEAAILTARRDKKKIGADEFREAIEKVLLGPERKSHVLSEKEKKITAYHEAGHALVAKILPNCDPVHKISIIARGMAAGYTWNPPAEDQHLYSKSKFSDDLAMMLGGRVAEETTFDEITTGAENDLSRATKLARKMVTEYGMSKKLGPLTFGHKEELVFLGKELAEHRNYSEKVAAEIDDEVAEIINEAHKRAEDVISKHKVRLKEVAEKLIKEESIEGEEFEKLFVRKKLASSKPAKAKAK